MRIEGRGDGGHCNSSKLDELNVSGGGSNNNGVNGANNPNRKKKKKRRHRFDYVFQHHKKKRWKPKTNFLNGHESIDWNAAILQKSPVVNGFSHNLKFPFLTKYLNLVN